jgi:outer membrane receptor protein involved in Fe transport
MRKTTSYSACMLLALFLSIAAFAQTVTITGNVKNSSNQDIVPAVSVTLKGTSSGTFTDDKGNFTLTTTQKPPFTLVFSSVGFESQEVTVNSASQAVNVSFRPSSTLGTEVVVSASRVPERILESPVSIERVGAAAVRASPAASYYDIVANLKGVDVVTSSMTFKTPTTRGFSKSGNTRFNQLVDGMDNLAPGLNFSVGAIIGLSELDVDNMELLPGASSALYGPGGMNGTLLISSKNPFKYTGLSFQIKEGMMNTDGRYRDISAFHNWTARWAENINNRFAYKITADFIQAKDWVAADKRNYAGRPTGRGQIVPGTRESDPNFDGINVYGDETTADIRAVFRGIAAQAPFLAPYINSISADPINVSRTGYDEKDIIDPSTLNFKLGGAVHYKFTDKLEGVIAGNWGTGNSVYTGNDRYSFKDFKMGQYKLELNHRNWFLRTYTTQENAGQSFAAVTATRLTNEAWKSSTDPVNGWYSQYGQAYLASKMAGLSDAQAHSQARSVADVGRPAAGSDEFKELFNRVRSVPLSQGGALFIEQSDMYQTEGQYNLSDITGKVADVLVGANYKVFNLDSKGTLFVDTAGTIKIREYGAYVQASRRLFNDVLKLTFSGRYDKNENFEGRFTPRATAVIKVAENNNVRVSYQTAYRFPSTQAQFINLFIGGGTQLIGGDKSFQTYYNFTKNKPYDFNVDGTPGGTHNFKEYKPESVSSYEVGYKGLFGNKLLFDVYGYYGKYTNFLARTIIGQPASEGAAPNPMTDRRFSVPYNVDQKVNVYGFGISIDYRLPANFVIGGNLSSDVLDNADDLKNSGFIANFNTPKYRTNLSLSNNSLGKKKLLGMSIVYKWQDAFFYEEDFGNGGIPAIHTLDAQVSYKIVKYKSVVKLGANNLLNQYYYNGIGNSFVGGLYYVSFGYNIF